MDTVCEHRFQNKTFMGRYSWLKLKCINKNSCSVFCGIPKAFCCFELLPCNRTITAEYYCEQLKRLRAKIIRLRPLERQLRSLHDKMW